MKIMISSSVVSSLNKISIFLLSLYILFTFPSLTDHIIIIVFQFCPYITGIFVFKHYRYSRTNYKNSIFSTEGTSTQLRKI